MAMDQDRLLRAAAAFLGRRPNATQDEIAAAIGISRATLHRYFAGRAALIEALEQLALSQVRTALNTARWREGPAAQALQRLVAACEPVSGYLTLLYTHSQEFDIEELKQGWAEIDAEIRELFLRGQRDGEFRPDLTATWLTEAFYNLVAGAGWSIRSGRAAPRDFTAMITELLLRGVCAHGAPAPAASSYTAARRHSLQRRAITAHGFTLESPSVGQ
ncbi:MULTISPECIES: TetR/AcrR family transcriptional regulator [Mycobacterium]|uniref:TetR/AcrR family transcriptional regulator n=1 Tax=Mycobacterium TaxID=1763 RepID=UPI0009EB03B8|nr:MULTISPECIES: TetR/AcrR family transcriptional regulator [Mycobacterium]MDP7732189.1 TetR/AcrR family transcriptional regulator [Mycobacterium sp. TY813]